MKSSIHLEDLLLSSLTMNKSTLRKPPRCAVYLCISSGCMTSYEAWCAFQSEVSNVVYADVMPEFHMCGTVWSRRRSITNMICHTLSVGPSVLGALIQLQRSRDNGWGRWVGYPVIRIQDRRTQVSNWRNHKWHIIWYIKILSALILQASMCKAALHSYSSRVCCFHHSAHPLRDESYCFVVINVINIVFVIAAPLMQQQQVICSQLLSRCRTNV